MTRSRNVLSLLLVLLCVSSGEAVAQGLILPGAGAVNRSLGGASTAFASDAAGAGYWNPATIRAVPDNEVMFGAELLYVDLHLSSAGPMQAGSNFSNGGLPALPTIAYVYHSESMPITYGMGVYALLGGGVNFPQAPTNPITNATGPLYASASVLGIQPSASVQMTDRLSVGAGPIVAAMNLGLNPAVFAPNADGTFPVATPGRPFWGGGFQIGFLYDLTDYVDLGFSYKSPIWFETFKFNAQDENGNPRELLLDLSLPQILSAGVAYHGIPCTTFALDVRYLDYSNSTLFGDSIPTPGVAWDSVWAVALGAERQLGERLTLRAGYSFNENPIPDAATLFNLQLPGILQQHLSLGGSLKMTDAITLDTAVIYAFSSSIGGSVPLPPPVGGRASLGLKMDAISLALSLRFAY